jgi:hypothetical protein
MNFGKKKAVKKGSIKNEMNKAPHHQRSSELHSEKS